MQVSSRDEILPRAYILFSLHHCCQFLTSDQSLKKRKSKFDSLAALKSYLLSPMKSAGGAIFELRSSRAIISSLASGLPNMPPSKISASFRCAKTSRSSVWSPPETINQRVFGVFARSSRMPLAISQLSRPLLTFSA